MNELANLAINKIQSAHHCQFEAEMLSRHIAELREKAAQLRAQAEAIFSALRIASGDGLISPDDLQAVSDAIDSPERLMGEGTMQDEPEPSEEGDEDGKLIEELDQIAATMGGEFGSAVVKEKLQLANPSLYERTHPASITGTLNRLVKLGRLERVGQVGKGREAIFKWKEGVDPKAPISPKRTPRLDVELLQLSSKGGAQMVKLGGG
jgi:hypothetical protein